MLATPDLIHEAGQAQRLAERLPRWAAEVPLYLEAGGGVGVNSFGAALPEFSRFPLITKADLRQGFPQNFLRVGQTLDELLAAGAIELEHTSGTSEERTPLLLPRGWWGEQERRALQLNARVAALLEADPGARRVTICSPVCNGEICYNGTPSRDERLIGNTLFVSLSRYPFLWRETELARMAEETLEWRPRFLDVDPIYGVMFALYCERRGLRFPGLEFILCSYEFVSVVHRRVLERVFGVPVFDLYGSTETGHLLMEDERGQMRPSLETAIFEVLATDAQGIGELIVTTLTNDFMPLIRYRIGDVVERWELPYGTRYVLHGRTADAFVTASGRRVTTRHIDQCFAGVGGLAHYQLVERPGREWLVRFVAENGGPSAAELDGVWTRLSNLLESGAGVVWQPTDLLVPEGSGKFRLGYPAAK